ETVDPGITTYLNRLSDVLFTFARLENHRAGRSDVEWVKPVEGAGQPGEGAGQPGKGAGRPGEGAGQPGEGADPG
ncbi:MAG: hypothetical protein GWN71_01685, partial [Gammaproteobacteria bacterium]|nr:hypothetical protein [Gemmatimonadota bacterium]NIR34755.1 hypothetical protein [Actinomycetota bacterium]NIU72325.1 hypothetical protein [Gammaproteobacteria bacterium]NIX18577.1 hypothetical protein [Actinomycetota bacterium]